MKKYLLRFMAWLTIVAMAIPSVGNAAIAFAAEGKVAYEGSVTFSDSDWWTEHEASQSELLGNVNPEDVSYVHFYSDETTFNIGYSDTKGGWTVAENRNSYDVNDIMWGATFKFGLSKADGVDYTIKWKVYTGDAQMPTEDNTGDGEVVYMSTQINPSWGVYTNAISTDTLAKYKDGVIMDVTFTVDSGAGYGLLTPVNAITGWPALVDYCVNTNFNSEDGKFMAFGPEGKSARFTLTAEGVQEVVSGGGGLILQGFQVKVTKVILNPLAPKATPTPTPTPTPIPTPVPVEEDDYTTVGDVLVVTEDMVEDGEVVIEKSQYNRIVIPRTLSADRIVLKTVKANEVVVEGGADYTVTIYRGEVTEVKVAKPEIDEITFEELSAMLEEAEDSKELAAIVDAYLEHAALLREIEKAQPTVETTYWTTVGSIDVAANVELKVNDCEVDQINVSVKEVKQTMNVTVADFAGKVSVDTDREDGALKAAFALKLKNADVTELNVSGNDSSCFVEGINTMANIVSVSGTESVVLNIDAEKLLVDEETNNARIRVYSEIDEVIVQGDATSIVLPSCASIGNAVVEGDSVKIYGYGELASAQITGASANVAIYGTAVEGENDSTPPQAMLDMNPHKEEEKAPAPTPTPIPLEGAAYAGSLTAKDSGYWAASTVSKADLLGTVAAEDVKYIVFSSDVVFAYGYQSTDGNNTVAPDNPYYYQESGSRRYAADNMELGEKYYLQLILTTNTQEDKTIIWRVYTEGGVEDLPEEEKVTSVTIKGTGGWTDAQIYKIDLLGGVAPEKVESITFTCDTPVQIGFNSISKGEYVSHPDQTNFTTSDIDLGQNYFVHAGLSSTAGVDYVVHWQLNLKDETSEMPENPETPETPEQPETPEVPEEPSGVHTFEYVTDTEGKPSIPTYKFLLKDYLSDIKVNDKVKITVNFSSDVYFSGILGTNTYDGSEYGVWKQTEEFKQPTSVEIEIEVPHAALDYVEAQVQIWWMNETTKGVTIDSIVVERVADEPENGGSVTPDSPIQVELDINMPEADASGNYLSVGIPAEKLSGFTGDVAFDLNYVLTGEESWFNAMTPSWEFLATIGDLRGEDSEGTITFVIKAEDIAKAVNAGKLTFQYGNMHFTEGELRPATSRDYYRGDHQPVMTFDKDFLDSYAASFGEEITLTFDLIVLEGFDYQILYFQDTDGWESLEGDFVVSASKEFNDEYNNFGFSVGETSFNVKVNLPTLMQMFDGDLYIVSYGIVVNNILISK